MERDMRKKARLLTREASTAVRMIYKIDPQWALTFIKKQRDENVVHELNCWITRNASMDDDGYTIMNMRGTQIPGTKPRWNYLVRPLSRQMGIVAGGQGDKLLLTFEGGDYVVTHLCRNKACFNPEHLLVETKEQNELRKTCHESFVIRTADGTVIHPCTHWMGGARVQCVLPVRDVPAPAVGKYVDMSLGGPVLRTGRSNQ
ncbi:hypothetical protein V502_02228 [Pseudogymnoascus sp. VKM F-4520 (FW-2644)]|nr:hypothetical protein V502_02228 [Pseudogymnoascus sp. VKM F-4520 (FW-2644)]